MTEEKRPQAEARPAAVPAQRPKLASVAGAAPRQAPTPLKVPTGQATSPRPPAVAPASPASPAASTASTAPAEGREPSPSSPAPTETVSGMSQIAVEAALADLSSWRRDADRKLLRLEAELSQLRANGAAIQALHTGPPTLDLSSVTAPMPAAPAREPLPPWAVTPAIPPLVTAPAAPASAPAVAAPAPVAAPPAEAAAPRVVSIARPAEPRVQYELELKPGETFDMPSGLDGGRRKRVLASVVVTLICSGMAALVISALASQR